MEGGRDAWRDGWMDGCRWMDTESLGRTDQEDEERELPLMWRNSSSALNCLGMDDEQAESLRVRVRGQPVWVTLWWVSVTDLLIRKKKYMRYFSGIGRSFMFTGSGPWARDLNHPETSWTNKAQVITEVSGFRLWQFPNTGRRSRIQWGKILCWTSYL